MTGVRWVLLVPLLVLAACTAVEPGAMQATPVPDPLLETAQRDGSVVVTVDLLVPPGSAGSVDPARIGKAQRRLMSELGPGARVVDRFERKVPRIALRVTPEALQELRQSPRVINITLSETND